MSHVLSLKSFCVLILGAQLLAGCDKQTTLFSSIEERQANSVMAALLAEGICLEEFWDKYM